ANLDACRKARNTRYSCPAPGSAGKQSEVHTSLPRCLQRALSGPRWWRETCYAPSTSQVREMDTLELKKTYWALRHGQWRNPFEKRLHPNPFATHIPVLIALSNRLMIRHVVEF